MSKTIIVTGHGRSGTHWLAGVLGHFVDAHHEPNAPKGHVTVDCRLWNQTEIYRNLDHKVLHLVRDGRDVVRSTHTFWAGNHGFRHYCERWVERVNACGDLPVLRLEDLTAPADPSKEYTLPHWTEWSEEMTEEFWSVCGEAMRRHGYER